MSKCLKTQKKGFPHHWECVQLEGHVGCSCDNNTERRCKAFECTLDDGSHRVPDGSIVAKAHLQKGGLALRSVNLATGETKVLHVSQ